MEEKGKDRKWVEGGIRALNICVLHVAFTS